MAPLYLLIISSFYSTLLCAAAPSSADDFPLWNGNVSIDAEGKIVGGQKAVENEFPYQLYLQIKWGEKEFGCGASIINRYYALTAAHCIVNKQGQVAPVSGLRLYAGTLNIEKGYAYYRDVSLYKIHHAYNHRTENNDLALLRVSTEFVASNGVRPVDLIRQGAQVPLRNAIVAGWGRIFAKGPPSEDLLKVTIPVQRDQDCREVYRLYNSETMLCAGYVEGGRDTCDGDSGGALVMNGVQIGIVSFGKEECAEYPAVYTKVSTFRNWIDENSQ